MIDHETTGYCLTLTNKSGQYPLQSLSLTEQESTEVFNLLGLANLNSPETARELLLNEHSDNKIQQTLSFHWPLLAGSRPQIWPPRLLASAEQTIKEGCKVVEQFFPLKIAGEKFIHGALTEFHLAESKQDEPERCPISRRTPRIILISQSNHYAYSATH